MTSGNGDREQAQDAEIAIQGLTKTVGPQTVFEDVTCDLPRGKITVILGPSGTGKSVFLKHLVGLLKPDRGNIWPRARARSGPWWSTDWGRTRLRRSAWSTRP